MPIPAEHRLRRLYHFVHIENLPSILAHGLLAFGDLSRTGGQFISVAAEAIRRTRSEMIVPRGPRGVVHDYVPLYFCKRSTMFISVVNSKNFDQQFLIYYAFPIDILDQPSAVFTDAAANTASAPPAFYDDPADLSRLNWGAIDCLKWNAGSDELNHARMAEALIREHLDPREACHIAVWNEGIAGMVRDIYNKAGVTPPSIRFDSQHFVVRYWQGNGRDSLVTGPWLTRQEYNEAVKLVDERLGKAESPRFATLFALRDALKQGLECLPATAELVGLESVNSIHFEDAGSHTVRVVGNVLSSPEYEQLNKTDRLLVELVGFFHDVGKGPKSRWARTGGRYKVDSDHPLQGMGIVASVLVDEVASMKRRSARLILKLVCYHDLVGDILGKGRDEKQLVDIVEDERELDMLITLGKADVLALKESWWDAERAAQMRSRVMEALGADAGTVGEEE